MAINKNKLAVAVCKREGKKRSLPIGQVKEVMKCMGDELAFQVKRGRAKASDVLKVFGL